MQHDQPKQTEEKIAEQKDSAVARFLRIAAYPISLFSGLWVLKNDVHDMTYENLKRYGAFDKILKVMQPRNSSNVQARVNDEITKEVFLERAFGANGTKHEYSKQVADQMEHMGLGGGWSNFRQQWQYIRKGGQRSAVINALTVTGITIGAILTIANTKTIRELFSKDPDQSIER